MSYLVHVVGNGEPKQIHETYDEARNEAERLAQTTGTANKEIRIYSLFSRYKVVKKLEYISDTDSKENK